MSRIDAPALAPRSPLPTRRGPAPGAGVGEPDRTEAMSRRIGRLGIVVWLALVLLVCLSAPAHADDCSGPSDCQAPPGNADAATGLAAGMAVLAIVLATAAR